MILVISSLGSRSRAAMSGLPGRRQHRGSRWVPIRLSGLSFKKRTELPPKLIAQASATQNQHRLRTTGFPSQPLFWGAVAFFVRVRIKNHLDLQNTQIMGPCTLAFLRRAAILLGIAVITLGIKEVVLGRPACWVLGRSDMSGVHVSFCCARRLQA